VTKRPNNVRETRIDEMLEELRLNTEDLRQLMRRAVERAQKTARAHRVIVAGRPLERRAKY